jgi:hypothetical protein
MTVYLSKQSPVSGWLAAARQSGRLRMQALAVLAALLMGMPTESHAQQATQEETVSGADIVDKPDDPKSDKNLYEKPPADAGPFKFSDSVDVKLPCGEPEVIRTVNLTKLIEENSAQENFTPDWKVKEFGLAYFEFKVNVSTPCPAELIIVLAEGLTAENVAVLKGLPIDVPFPVVSDGSILNFYALSVDGVSYHTPGKSYGPQAYNTSGDQIFNTSNVFRDPTARKKTYKVNIVQLDVNKGLTTSVLAVILRPITTCAWTVDYSGDFTGYDYGDLAYYNNFRKKGNRFKGQGGVAIATGNAVDEKVLLMAEAGGLLPKGGGVYTEEEYQALSGTEVDIYADEDDEPEEPPSSYPAKSYSIHEFEDFASGRTDVLNKSEFETFGLVLAGRKINNKMDPMTAFLQSAGGVTIELASRAKLNEFLSKPGEKEFPMPLSRVRMSIPEGIFTWEAGGSDPAPYLALVPGEAAYGLRGSLEGIELKSEKRLLNNYYANISVDAKFVAAEGALGCDLGFWR